MLTVHGTYAHILIATPDSALRIALARAAARLDVTALVVTDSAATLAAALPLDPMLMGVVIDSRLPDGCGLDIAYAIRGHSADLPIALICDDNDHIDHASGILILDRSSPLEQLSRVITTIVDAALLPTY